MSYNPNDILGGGAWTFIEGVDISDDASVDFVLSGSFKMYQVHMTNIIPANDDARLDMRMSTDGGSTFFSGASDYDTRFVGLNGTTNISLLSPNDAEIKVGPATTGKKMGNTSSDCLNGYVYIHNALQSAKATCVTFEVSMVCADQTTSGFYGGGMNGGNIVEVDAISLFAFSGNLTSGRMELWGLGLS